MDILEIKGKRVFFSDFFKFLEYKISNFYLDKSFLTEFDPHLGDLTFVPKVHNGVQMGLKGIDEPLFPIIAPRLLGEVVEELQGPTAIYTDGSKTDGLVRFGIFLDDRD
jgi:hypothetical protein